ncbi:MAG: ABC transporter ATP-binding protein [Betaproteobacteria bacterium]|nr:MAG: ABC transporter ATP-binding protein [Betaproteobacteria bacterium]
MALLKVSSVETLYFDRIYALFGVSLEVEEGEIFAVLGPNGAGKTTLLRTIAGLLKDQPKKGEIVFDGRRVHRWQPESIARLGVVYVPEDRGLFKELTVAENLELGLWGRRDADVARDLESVHGMFPILRERAGQEAETLSGGEQQMLALGRAMLRRPRLLMLDEPSLGLAPRIAKVVYEALTAISRTGTTILLVEQNARLALGVARRGAILEAGRVVLEGTAKALMEDENVRELYLGVGTAEDAAKGWRQYRRRRRW